MRKRMLENPEFEWKLSQCSNIDEVCQLTKQDPEVHMNLVKKSCSPPIKLICDLSECLYLKNNQMVTCDAITDEEIDIIFASIHLDQNLNKKETNESLKEKLLLKHFLDHCCKQPTYFLFVKKCGITECTTSAANKYYSTASHHEQKNKKTTGQIEFLGVTIKQ